MKNVIIVSYAKRPDMYYSIFGNTSEKMIRFEYRIELADKIANFIRKNTNVCREFLINPDSDRYYLDDDNIVKYSYLSGIEFSDDINKSFIHTVERISNQGDEEFFINHILTDNGKHKCPSDIHKQMHDEYGMFDLSEDDFEECFEAELEWNVAHFFIHLTGILYDPGYEGD